MSTPFMAEMRIISFNFAPKGWALCNGQLLPINQNQALFSLLGTTYGGNGQTTFALPDLRSRTPIGQGSQFSSLGEKGGQEAHTIIQTEMPAHLHFANASTQNANNQFIAGTFPSVFNNTPATVSVGIYKDATSLTSLNPSSVTNTGGSQPHENRQPYLAINIIIALQGIFPSQN